MTNRIEQLRRKHLRRNSDGFISLDKATNEYLSGFSGSTSAVLVTRKRAVFFTDFRYREQSKSEVKGIEIRETSKSLILALVREARRMNVTRLAFEPTRLLFHVYRDIKRRYSQVELKTADGWVESLREIKDQTEIATIREAVSIAEKAYLDVITMLKEGVREREVAAELDYMMRRYGADASAFETIALFGERSALPHGQPGDRRLKNGDIILMDFGARLRGYHSDLTRTITFGKIPSSEFETIYNTVLEAQLAALDGLCPDIQAHELDGIARRIIDERGYGELFGHGLGHGVGLEIHERPHVSVRNKKPIKQGMVLTIEPGVYVPDVGGVRIEDTVVVTDSGCKPLSTIPKTLTVL